MSSRPCKGSWSVSEAGASPWLAGFRIWSPNCLLWWTASSTASVQRTAFRQKVSSASFCRQCCSAIFLSSLPSAPSGLNWEAGSGGAVEPLRVSECDPSIFIMEAYRACHSPPKLEQSDKWDHPPPHPYQTQSENWVLLLLPPTFRNFP